MYANHRNCLLKKGLSIRIIIIISGRCQKVNGDDGGFNGKVEKL